MSGTIASTSAPVPTSSTSDPHANTAQTTVEELVAYLKRRKILWELHLCLSASNDIQETGNHVSVVLDGDTADTVIRVMTLVGPIYPNVHYVVIFVPPVGYYIIGALDNGTVRQMPAILLSNDVDVTLTSTGNPIQIGDVSTQNMVIDGNEIEARNAGAGSDLFINNNGKGPIHLGGPVSMSNEIFDTVSIVPVANTPTSSVISFSTLTGTGSVCGWVTANTSVPETQVLMFSYSAISSSGITVWIYRINTTSTSLSWMVKVKQ